MNKRFLNMVERICDSIRNKQYNKREAKEDSDKVLLVDDYDKVVSIENTKKEYDLKAILQRGYLVTLFERYSGKIIVAQRSIEKEVWPGYLDGTVASHLQEQELMTEKNYIRAAEKRILFELGAEASGLEFVSQFNYYRGNPKADPEEGICALITGFINPSLIRPNQREVSNIKILSSKELLKDMKKNVDAYCPWFKTALMYA